MLGEAGYMTDLPAATLNNMIDVVKGDRTADWIWSDPCAL